MDTEDVIKVECAECLSDINPDDAYETTYGSKILCSDCVRSCERCGDVGDENDQWCDVDNELWCGDCTSNRAYWCDSCEEYSTDSTVYIRDRGASWCASCVEDATFCEDCDEYYADGCDRCEESRLIHDYQYRPDPIFHSTDKNARLFFGIEVEVEAPNDFANAADYAHRLEGMELAYLKHDGSLNHGFEVVTHPMTHDYYKNEATDLWDTFDKLRRWYKVGSWSTGTCGVHVHISRTGFNGGPHMHRFLSLVYGNQKFFEAIAGRSSDRWAKFDDAQQTKRTTEEDGTRGWHSFRSFKYKLSNGENSDRYSAVNTQNANTLEMRIFRGSTNSDTIKSYLDLAHASVEYTRTISVKQVVDGALKVEPFIEYINANKEIYKELCERMERLDIVVRLAEQKVSN
jgi:hypothetical protein